MDYISNNIGIAHLGKTRTEEGKIFANSNLSKNKSNETKAQAKEPNIKAVEGSDQSNEPIPTGKRGEAETTIPTTTQTEKIGGQDATQTGKIPTSNLAEYPNRDTSGQTAETSGSNSNVSSGEKQTIPQQEEVTQQGGNNVGVSHAALTDLAKRLNLDEPQRGAYIEPEMYADRGRKLLAAGADPNEINNPNNTLHDRIAIGRAHLEDLTKIADAMAKKWGVDSPQFEEAQRAVNDYSKQIKELGTDAHRAMVSLQGNRDLDTDSFTAVKTEVENNSGRKLNATQQKKIEQLTTENQKLKQQAEEAEAKLIEETEKAFQAGVEEGKKKTTSQKAKTVANKLREAAKLSKPGTFSAASPASLVWDTAVEAVAKSIEAGGKIAEAIEEGLKLIRESDWYKGITDDKKQKAEQEFKQFNFDNTGSSNLEDLQARFLDKKGNKFTREEAKDVWAYTKENYLDKGVSYRDAIINVSNDLGLSWRQVNEAISTPKTKRISDEMWKKQADYRRNQNATKTWIDDQEKNPAFKAIKKISDKFRAVAVFGHGGIFMGTHAGMTLFQPTTWDKTIPAFFRGWKFAYGKVANHERAMEELKNRENYVIAQRAGLKNNPDRVNVEEYQKSQSYLGKLGGAGERGFNAIKVLRQDLFDYHYNRLNDVEKADPKAVEQIAKLVNLATGATNLNIPEWINEVTFAGGMEAARWGKLTRSPINATTTALRALYAPDKVSLEDKVFAKVWASRVGQQLATFTSLLLANAALQNYLNPKNPVNLTDPTKPDLFKFKVGDLTIDPTSGMRSAGMFIYGIGKIPFEQQKELHGDTRLQAASKSVFSYGRGKLSPAYSTLADFYTGQDYNKNPLPFSSDKPTAGHHKLTWGEYLWQKAPLPIAEAATVTYKSAEDHGADKPTLNNILTGIVSGAISGSTGFRVGEYNAEESNHSPFTDEDKKDPTFKFFIDKGLNLPNTSLSSETVPGTDNKIADYPKEVQDKYIKAHKEALKEELQNIKENGIVYVTKNKTLRGEIVTHVAIDEPDNDNYTEVKIDDLTTEELAQLLSIAQSQATKQAKEEVFNNDEQ